MYLVTAKSLATEIDFLKLILLKKKKIFKY